MYCNMLQSVELSPVSASKKPSTLLHTAPLVWKTTLHWLNWGAVPDQRPWLLQVPMFVYKFFQHWFFHVLVLSKHSPWLCFGGEWCCVGLGSRQADISRMCGVSCSCRDGRRGGKGAGTEDDDEIGTEGAMPSNRRKRESGPCWGESVCRAGACLCLARRFLLIAAVTDTRQMLRNNRPRMFGKPRSESCCFCSLFTFYLKFSIFFSSLMNSHWNWIWYFCPGPVNLCHIQISH